MCKADGSWGLIRLPASPSAQPRWGTGNREQEEGFHRYDDAVSELSQMPYQALMLDQAKLPDQAL